MPAKINPLLRVRGRRDDGYHELTTVLQTVSLHDELRAEMAGPRWAQAHPAARQLLRLELSHDGGPDVPAGARNLELRAARLLLRELRIEPLSPAECADVEPPVTRLRLTKRIPVAGGMAGGSADAAAALVALDRLWQASCAPVELADCARRLGADVPFCLSGGTALGAGVGADHTAVLAGDPFHWVAATSAEGLSTAAVYAAWDELDAPPPDAGPEPVLAALRSGDPAALAAAAANDLQQAALSLRPGLGDGLEQLRSAGALTALVSGSGPTLLGLASDEAAARGIAASVSDAFDAVHVLSAPAGGPELRDVGADRLRPADRT